MNPDTNPNQPTQPQGPVEFPTTPVATGEPLVTVESANIPAAIETPIAVEALAPVESVVTNSFSAAPVSPEVPAVAPVDQPPVMGSAPVVAPLAAVAVTSKKKSMTLIAIIVGVIIVLGVIGFIAFSLLTA